VNDLRSEGSGVLYAPGERRAAPAVVRFDQPHDRFLVNIRDPACVIGLASETLDEVARINGLAAGPHGLDIDRTGDRAFVACDEGSVCVIDLTSDREVARVPIAGEPDAIWYSSTANAFYVAIGSPGVLEVLDTSTMRVVQQGVTEEGAHTTAFDAQRCRLYVFLPTGCAAAVYDESSD
jgi:hypothetical protein